MALSVCGSTAEVGVVQDQHVRVGQQRPGERDALPLAAGQGQALLADDAVEALGQVVDEVRRRLLEHAPQVFLGGLRPGVEQVGPHGVGEQEGIVGGEQHAAAQVVEPQLTDVDTTDPDGTRGHVVEAGEEATDGRGAGPRRADQGGGDPAGTRSVRPARMPRSRRR